MSRKVEITIDVIVHATEDINKFYSSFEEVFGIGQDQFRIQELEGHFDNPILMLGSKASDDRAVKIIERISSALSRREKAEILDTLGERTDSSSLYLRIGKQEFVQKRIVLKEENAIKMKIYKPIYRKKDMVAKYEDLLNFS